MGVEGGSVLIPSRAQILEKLMRHVYFKQYFTRHEFEREYCKIHASRINFGPNRALRINSFSPSVDWLVNFQIERN